MPQPNIPRTAINLPGTTAEEVRGWARNVTEANPIGTGALSDESGIELDITDHPFMGVELTFVANGVPLHCLAIFAEVPTTEERIIMETTEAQGLVS